MNYSCIRLDAQSPSFPHLAQKYKSLRLSALTQSPSSFSSTYDIESRFTDEMWESRLRLLGVETFVCVAYAPGTSADDGKWIAQVTLRGPIPAASYSLPDAARQPPVLTDEEEEKWQMLSLYTLPSYRGKGAGKALCGETFRWLKSKKAADDEPESKQLRVRIMVKPENTATVKMYEGLGFESAGRCTLAEALTANGDGEMVPEDGGGQKYNNRTGLIMVKTFERE